MNTIPSEIRTSSGLKYIDDKDIGGNPIRNGQLIRINYWIALNWEDLCPNHKNLIDTSETKQEPIIIKVGEGSLLPGIEEGIQGMCKGNSRYLIIKPELAFGKRGIPSIVPENAILYVEINISTKTA